MRDRCQSEEVSLDNRDKRLSFHAAILWLDLGTPSQERQLLHVMRRKR